MLYKGTVKRVEEKSGMSKAGKPYTLYSLVLDTQAGEIKMGTAFEKPNAPPGAVVSVEAGENQRGYLDADLKTLQVLKEESSPAPAQGAVSNGVAAVDQRQRSIVAQSAYRTAAPVLTTALEQEIVKLPKAKSAANDQLDVYLEALDKIAQHIFDKTLTGMEQSEDDDTETGEEGTYDPLS